MSNNLSSVYIKIDEEGRILRCEGGYSISNINDVSQWIKIDEGSGDKYNLCQSNYFDSPLRTIEGICRWKYVDGECVLRTEDEIATDIAAIPKQLSEEETYKAALEVLGVNTQDETDTYKTALNELGIETEETTNEN